LAVSRPRWGCTTARYLEETAVDDTYIITVFVVFDELCQTLLPAPKYRPKMVPAEILTVAVVAARYFGNHLERALLVMAQAGYIPKTRCLSVSRFNRQLHRYGDFLELCLETLLELSQTGEAFIIDSMPVPVCKRSRARRCRKVRGREFCGYCAAKKEKFFGWRLHLICTPAGQPVAFELLPGAYHDLTPINELTVDLPKDAVLYGDKGYNDATSEHFLLDDGGVRLVPIRKKNMKRHDWADEYDLRLYRKSIETVNSQLESMGLERLRARTNGGFDIKVQASLIALWHTQAMAN
jgi:hypothetical protein